MSCVILCHSRLAASTSWTIKCTRKRYVLGVIRNKVDLRVSSIWDNFEIKGLAREQQIAMMPIFYKLLKAAAQIYWMTRAILVRILFVQKRGLSWWRVANWHIPLLAKSKMLRTYKSSIKALLEVTTTTVTAYYRPDMVLIKRRERQSSSQYMKMNATRLNWT